MLVETEKKNTKIIENKQSTTNRLIKYKLFLLAKTKKIKIMKKYFTR